VKKAEGRSKIYMILERERSVKTFYSVERESFWKITTYYEIPERIMANIIAIYENSKTLRGAISRKRICVNSRLLGNPGKT
jgi:predicted methyltransferase